jgi:geranylgeranyl diphosphate synthase type II
MYSQGELKKLIDRAILNLSFDPEAERLISPVRYILSIGGKRLRPVLSLMTCNMFSDKVDKAVLPATGIEVFHNFTLVHDDIMDHADLRRNLPTVHKKWNVNQAVLSGDVMAFIANEFFLQAPETIMSKVFKTYNKAAIEVCIGQQLDIDFENVNMISHEEYLRMIGLKTAALLAAAAKIGALIGEAQNRDSELMYEFGWNLGLAYQIQDDLLDVYGDTNVFGKIAGGDIVSNKKTFLLVKAFEMASGPQLKILQEQLNNKEADPDSKIRIVVEIYDSLHIRSITENLASDYISRSLEVLGKINVESERKSELSLLANSLIGRSK